MSLASEPLYPMLYVEEEMGYFTKWDNKTQGQISRVQLLKKLRGNSIGKKAERIEINGTLVHCLIFSNRDYIGVHQKDVWEARWDCINGWTTPIPSNRYLRN